MRKPLMVFGTLVTAAVLVLASCAMPYDDPNYSAEDRAEVGALAGDPVGTGEQAQQVSDATANPTSLGIDTPLAAMPESGKEIMNLSNETQLGPVQDAAMAEAAATLGWTVETSPLGTTAEEQAAAIDKAVAAKPDGIAVSWIDTVAVEDSLAKAETAGIPIVCTGCTGDPTGAVKDTSIAGTEQELAWGRIMAAFIADNSNNDASIQWFNLPAVPALVAFLDGVQQGLSEVCPPCYSTTSDQEYASPPSVDVGTITDVIGLLSLETFLGSVSGDLFDEVTDPKVAKAFEEGLFDPAPLLVGNIATASNIEGLRTKEEAAWTVFSAPIAGWRVIDSFARIFAEEPVVTGQLSPQLLTQDNVADAVLDAEGNYVGLADYQEQFKKLWLVG